MTFDKVELESIREALHFKCDALGENVAVLNEAIRTLQAGGRVPMLPMGTDGVRAAQAMRDGMRDSRKRMRALAARIADELFPDSGADG